MCSSAGYYESARGHDERSGMVCRSLTISRHEGSGGLQRVTDEIGPVSSHGDGVPGAIVSVGPAAGVPPTAPVRLVPCRQHGKPSRSVTTVRDPRNASSLCITGGVRSQRSSRCNAGAA
jgi:hypothetical protein